MRNARALALAMLLASCGVTPHIPAESTVGSMTAKQARASLAAGLKGARMFTSDNAVPVADVLVTRNRLVVTDTSGQQSVFTYRDLPQITVAFQGLGGRVLMLGERKAFAIDPRVANERDGIPGALRVLQQDAIAAKKAADESDLAFAASLADYRRQVASGAALPEEAIRYKVQAEAAVRDKDYDEGAELYASALSVAPWWPVGHFNRALVLGELEDYAAARREMNYYLQLVPDAANARAAQDKIYQWQRLESKESK